MGVGAFFFPPYRAVKFMHWWEGDELRLGWKIQIGCACLWVSSEIDFVSCFFFLLCMLLDCAFDMKPTLFLVLLGFWSVVSAALIISSMLRCDVQQLQLS